MKPKDATVEQLVEYALDDSPNRSISVKARVTGVITHERERAMKAEEQRDRLQRELADLRREVVEVLRPFSEVATLPQSHRVELNDDSTPLYRLDIRAQHLNLGHCRRAKALAEKCREGK